MAKRKQKTKQRWRTPTTKGIELGSVPAPLETTPPADTNKDIVQGDNFILDMSQVIGMIQGATEFYIFFKDGMEAVHLQSTVHGLNLIEEYAKAKGLK